MPTRLSLFHRPALISLSLFMLAGCAHVSRPTPAEVDPKAMQEYTTTMQRVLRNSLAQNLQEETVGALKLQVSYNRQGQPLTCKVAHAAVHAERDLPAELTRTRWDVLQRNVERQCWNTLYPKAPEALYDDKGIIEVVAPLVVVLPGPPHAQWQAGNAQRAFFWQHLVSKEKVDSFGVAMIRYRADAQGKPLGCLVYLTPSPARPDGFKLDTELQNRLGSQCMKLDLSQLPETTLNEHQQVEGLITVEYAPWKRPRP